MEPNAPRPVRLAKHDGVAVAVGMWFFHQLGQPEQLAVPRDTALDIGHSDRNMVDSRDVRHGAPLLVSRRRGRYDSTSITMVSGRTPSNFMASAAPSVASAARS